MKKRESKDNGKRRHSIVSRVILVPTVFSILIFILLLAIFHFLINNAMLQIRESNLNYLSLSLSETESRTDICRKEMSRYISGNTAFNVLSNASEASGTQVWKNQIATLDWLKEVCERNGFLSGAAVYYSNLGWTAFRGDSDYAVHEFIHEQFAAESYTPNIWVLGRAGNRDFLIGFYRYNQLVCCFWMDKAMILPDTDNDTDDSSAMF